MVCSASWSWFFEARGEPTCVCGRVWVEQLEPEIMLLTGVPKAVDEPVAVARGASSPRVLVCDGVVVVSGPPADEDASSALGMVVANAGQPFG